MSVDPFIQAPSSTQSINPYSYIMNNPLAGTDPTGYMGKCDQNPTCQMQSFFSSVGSGGSSLIGNLLSGRLKTTLNNGHDTKQAKKAQDPKAAEVKSSVAVAEVGDKYSRAIASTIPVKQLGKGINNTVATNSNDGLYAASRGDGDAGAALGELFKDLFTHPEDYIPKRIPNNIQTNQTDAKGIEKRGVKPASGERTFQGQINSATTSGNPTVQRNGEDLVRLRADGHGQTEATATPQNVRNVAPNGKVFIGSGSDRAVTPRDIRELHKAKTEYGTSAIRTRKGKKKRK